jgi:hypothetical protein
MPVADDSRDGLAVEPAIGGVERLHDAAWTRAERGVCLRCYG